MTPDFWIDKAIQLTALWSDLKAEMLNAELKYNQEIGEYLGAGDTSASAKQKANCGNNYKVYKELKNRDEVVKEFIMLAKKRATINKEY